ncbi:MAG: type IV secretion system DNA-binding domain-containing protein [Chitinophagales bacterium]|nr:type IV secretion system DNA-binding domain-containing protein [Chitinophagales bacterium]
MDSVTPIGITNYRSTNQKFGIKDNDRLRHIYCIGKSGTGKSTLLKNMALSDIQRGNGLCVIDPHGDVAQELLFHIPEHRKNDLVYFNPADTENGISFNPLKAIHPKYHHLVASGLISAFKKIWYDTWGPRMEYILRYSLLTLLCVPDSTLLDVKPLLTNKELRTEALKYVTESHIRNFWIDEFEKHSPQFRNEVISPILNKVGSFSASVPMRTVFGQKSKGLRIQKVMDEKKILICNLSKGILGEDTSTLIGSILTSSIQLATLYRATQPEDNREPFYLYIDECHNFISLSFADILAESRKYGLSLFLSHQYIEQLDERIRIAIFGNVGTLISFRVGAIDAEYLSKEFYPVFQIEDFINLPRYCFYIKLMIDSATSIPFSAQSISFSNTKNASFTISPA